MSCESASTTSPINQFAALVSTSAHLVVELEYHPGVEPDYKQKREKVSEYKEENLTKKN